MDKKDKFFTWMINNGMLSTTARNYISSINKISEHCLQDRNEKTLYNINDISFIENLADKFNKKGEYYSFGCERNGGIRASLFKYIEFLNNPNSIKKPVIPVTRLPIEIDKFGIINVAFRKILPSLAKKVCDVLIERDNKNWWKKYVIDKLQKNAAENLPQTGNYEECKNRLDIQALLNIIEYNWMEIFKDFFTKNGGKYSPKKYFDWVKSLKTTRNDYDAHYTIHTLESFDDNDLARELENMACFMLPIDKEISNEIRSLKDIM